MKSLEIVFMLTNRPRRDCSSIYSKKTIQCCSFFLLENFLSANCFQWNKKLGLNLVKVPNWNYLKKKRKEIQISTKRKYSTGQFQINFKKKKFFTNTVYRTHTTALFLIDKKKWKRRKRNISCSVSKSEIYIILSGTKNINKKICFLFFIQASIFGYIKKMYF